MATRQRSEIDRLLRSTEAHASLVQDIVLWCAPVLDGTKPGAMFSFPYTMKPLEEIKVDVPQVLLIDEFRTVLDSCRAQLRGTGVQICVLAWREHGALVYVFRPDLVKWALSQEQTVENLEGLGYPVGCLTSCIQELKRRLRDFDALERKRDFWDFPHEMGYFLGYPAMDVMAYTRFRGNGYVVDGEWRAYGCKHRACAMKRLFKFYESCTEAYWNMYTSGATLADMAALGNVNLERLQQ